MYFLCRNSNDCIRRDSVYSLIFLLAGIGLSMWASYNVNAKFNKYSRMVYSKHVTAEVVANWILKQAHITNVRIERISGSLTDHYDPQAKVLRLSDSVYGSMSVSAIGVAAHECGHAIQDATGYQPLVARRKLVPACNIGSKLSMPIIILGLIFGATRLMNIGIILFTLVVLFQLVTLPVEFDASKRACTILETSGRFLPNEMIGVEKVLKAAAITYIASALNSILQLLRLVLISRNRGRR